MDNKLRLQLLDMVDNEKHVKESLQKEGSQPSGYSKQMEEIQTKNATALAHIIDQYNWPGKSLVGEDGAFAAWIIVQHAIGNPRLMKVCLKFIQIAVQKHDLNPKYAAMLEDRICFYEGRPQQYGTQFDWDENGLLSPWLIQDHAHVNDYREAVGLPPLELDILRMRDNALLSSEKPPSNWAKRQKEFDSWAHAIGWR